MAQNKLLLIWFFFFTAIPIILSGQHPRQDKMPAIGEISGTVVDSLTGKPLEYSSVSILKVNGEIETGGVTNKDGTFHIKEIKPGNYSIKIEFMGYAPTVISNIMLTFRGTLKKHIGTIKLNQILIPIDGATVIEDRPLFEFKTDKMIYNSSDDIIADSGTAEDILNKVPMVTVDQDGEVSLRGNPNVKILVNGRPNRMGEGENDVDNIPASLIDKVEVITSPSAKYDPDGMAGIINIILKKGKYEGLNGSLKINGKHNEFNSFDKMHGYTAYGNYKIEKWNLYSSLNINNRVRTAAGYRNVDIDYLNGDPIRSSHYILSVNSERPGNSLTLGTDYFWDESLEINGEIKYAVNKRNSSEKKFFTLPVIETISTQGADFDGNYNINGAMNIIKTFDQPEHKFSFSLNNNQKIDSGYVELIHSDDYTDRTILSGNIQLSELNLSYMHPLSNDNMFELGYDGKFNNNSEFMDFEFTDPHDENFLPFSGTNNFTYKRNIHAVFGEYDHKLSESFSIKPSLRYEYVSKDISFISNITEDNNSIIYAQILDSLGNQSVLDDYQIIYPDLHFTYILNEKQSLQFGMSKRVNRPGAGGHGRGSRAIRPFPRDIYSESFIFMGNPFLKPEYSTQHDISFKTPIPMGFTYSNLYFHQLKNIIEWVDDDRFENAEVLTFDNAESGTKIGVELFAMIMGQTIGGGYSRTKLEDKTKNYELNGTREHFSLFSRISLPEQFIKVFDYEFGFYYMNIKVPGGRLFGDKGTLWANTGVSKSFLEDKMTVSFSINNLFNSGGFQAKIEKPLYNENGHYANEFTDVSMGRHSRTYTLNIKFRFGQMQDEKRKQRSGLKRGDDEGIMDRGY
jgi:outer membrane receptor protein involved in Fe transport